MANANYRYELAKSARSKCQIVHDEGEGQIEKGDLRFGTLVTINEHTTWKWKHWGCVTPAQIAKVLTQIGGLEGLDIDNDLDCLDGWEELPDWAQAKIKYALVNGHVHNDDWKGDPELNVPGAKGGVRKRTPKKKKVEEDVDQRAEPEASPVPKSKKGRSKKQIHDDDGDDGENPKKKTPAKKRKAEAVDDNEDAEIEPAPKSKRRTKKTKAAVKEEFASDDEPKDVKKPVKKRGKTTDDTKQALNAQVDGANDKVVDVKSNHTRARASKKVKEESDVEAAPKPVRSRGKKTKKEPTPDSESEESEKIEAPKSTRKQRMKRAKAEVDDNVEEPVAAKPTKSRASSRKKT